MEKEPAVSYIVALCMLVGSYVHTQGSYMPDIILRIRRLVHPYLHIDPSLGWSSAGNNQYTVLDTIAIASRSR